MINFTVGPVQMDEKVRAIGGEQIPYFRTQEFSEMMLENERLMKKLAFTEEQSRAVFLTGSGTFAMEAAVLNSFTSQDKILIVNGGTFGERFVTICKRHQIPYEEIKLGIGEPLTTKCLSLYEGKGYTGFLVNVGETSTGVLYDMRIIGEFCRRNNIFLIADAISAFLADPLFMDEWKIQIMIVSSQKALACAPGISALVLSSEAVERIQSTEIASLYFDLKAALKDGLRGQTPFTPAVGILRQINYRLRSIEKIGIEKEISRVSELAEDFRNGITGLPLSFLTESRSNAVTALVPFDIPAHEVVLTLKNEYDIWVCPNGGELSNKVFRVGHIGALTKKDNKKLCEALYDMHRRNKL